MRGAEHLRGPRGVHLIRPADIAGVEHRHAIQRDQQAQGEIVGVSPGRSPAFFGPEHLNADAGCVQAVSCAQGMNGNTRCLCMRQRLLAGI